jgi:hypothetical protein
LEHVLVRCDRSGVGINGVHWIPSDITGLLIELHYTPNRHVIRL